MDIRLANESDLGKVLEFGRKLYEAESLIEPKLKYSADASKSHYLNEMKNPRAFIAIAMQNEDMAGYIYGHLRTIEYFHKNPQECIIEAIYIDERFRSMGVATSLIDFALRWGTQHSVIRYKVGVYSKNDHSMKLFQKAGFEDYHRTLVKKNG